MTFICYRKSLIVMCTFYRAHCLFLGHKSDFSVLISRSPLTAVLKLWHQPLRKVTVLYLFFWKADFENLQLVVLVACTVLCTLNHENLDQTVKLKEISARHRTQMQKSFGLHFQSWKLYLKKNNPQQTTKQQKQKKPQSRTKTTKKTFNHKKTHTNQSC